MNVVKRDGSRREEFSLSKIEKAVSAAGSESAHDIACAVESWVDLWLLDHPGEDISVETIEGVVENTLIEQDSPEVAREYISHRARTGKMRNSFDESVISDYIHASKYAKWQDELGRLETWDETVSRVERMHLDRFSPMIHDDIKSAFNYVRRKEVVPSMRAMQFAGPAIEAHNARGYNCSFTRINRPEVFGQIFFALLCGVGVGYSVQRHHVAKLPHIPKLPEKQVPVKFIKAEDSIEGWGNALHEVVQGAYDGVFVEVDYSDIRPEGAVLKTSGGMAPGHVPLRQAIEHVRNIMKSAGGRQLTPLEAHDIICHAADAVLSGGIRRSALICLFSYDDDAMFTAKNPENFRYPYGDDAGKNPQRALANNSVVLLRDECSKQQLQRIIRTSQSYGEPGFFFTDDLEYGTNPCAEIGLNPTEGGFQFCNLTEVKCCANETDMQHRCWAASLIGTLQAAYTDFTYLGDETRFSTEREALLGVSLTGMADYPECHAPLMLESCAKVVNETNDRWAKLLGIKPAARTTCVKPSGTASLVLGCASGIHPHHAKRFRRGVTANPNEAVAQEFQAQNPHLVSTKPNGDWFLKFPSQAPDGCITVKEESALDFLDRVRTVYEHWVVPGARRGNASHNVSATVTFEPHELESCIDYIWEHRDSFAALSFAPKILDESIPYCPRKEVGPDEWEKITDLKHVDYVGELMDRTLEAACAGGACTI